MEQHVVAQLLGSRGYSKEALSFLVCAKHPQVLNLLKPYCAIVLFNREFEVYVEPSTAVILFLSVDPQFDTLLDRQTGLIEVKNH